MAVINILSPHVADLIAAGEVVERPASVIKELVENSFDAGARNITVEIHGGGSTFIRVTDDGCGMAPEDAGIAFMRHATSKLKDEAGLEAIATMGFRGEALAAISSVSRIDLRTRQHGAAEGTCVVLEAGEIQDMGPAGCPDGTTITVTDIFYNTPARLKFLKSDRSEASACISTALRCALGHPEVSVRFIRDGKEEFFSPGDGRKDSAVYTLLGRDFSNALLACDSTVGSMRVSGFVTSPSAGRGNRTYQHFYCNGRYIKSALLQAALEQAYKNSLLSGRYPGCVLWLELGYNSVDVNVHPAKTEVKFSAEKEVFNLVYQTVLATLQKENRIPGSDSTTETAAEEPVSSTAESVLPSTASSWKRAAEYMPSSSSYGRAHDSGSSSGSFHSRGNSTGSSFSSVFSSPSGNYQTRLDLAGSAVSREKAENGQKAQDIAPSVPAKTAQTIDLGQDVENSVQNVESCSVPDHKIVGEAFRTYIIVEAGENVIIIDKHAAHERMIFDRLKATGHSAAVASQFLMEPVTIRPTHEDAELLDRNHELLAELGFEIECFGETDYIVRSLPADIDVSDVPSAVEEICDKLKSRIGVDPASVRDEILHTVACKAAIKAGYDNGTEELEVIAREVLSGRVRYCPHGRPVSVSYSRQDFEKLFKRIV